MMVRNTSVLLEASGTPRITGTYRSANVKVGSGIVGSLDSSARLDVSSCTGPFAARCDEAAGAVSDCVAVRCDDARAVCAAVLLGSAVDKASTAPTVSIGWPQR